MSYIAKLKQNRSSNLERIKEKLASQKSTRHDFDDTYWNLKKDEATAVGSAVVRMLPPKEGEEYPFVQLYEYSFNVDNRWYIEKSLATIGEADPVSEAYFEAKKAGNADLEKLLSRRVSYVTNSYIVKDPAVPDNEGGVFRYKFGIKIWQKVLAKMNGDPDLGIEPLDVFDLWAGANFNVRSKKLAGWVNYDDSSFLSPGPFVPDDQLDDIMSRCHSLEELVDPSTFKSYDELKDRMNFVLYGPTRTTSTVPTAADRIRQSEPPFDLEDVSQTVAETKEVSRQQATANPKAATKDDDFNLDLDGIDFDNLNL